MGVPLGSAPADNGGVLVDALIHKALARQYFNWREWLK